MSDLPSVMVPTGQIGRYEVSRPLGSGSFASVYLATDPRLDVEVAAKVLGDLHCGDPEIRERFIQEARLMRRVGSQHLVSVFDIDQTTNGQPFFVMEYLQRGTIADRLETFDYVQMVDIRRLINDLADGLGVMHEQGVVHRDVKPSNLLVRHTPGSFGSRLDSELLAADEVLVLADFGLAKDLSRQSTHLTVVGGTRAYMAPEQYDPAASVDHRADLHAASAVLFEVVTGVLPEFSDRVKESNFPQLLAELWVGMSESPEERHDSAEHWRSALLATLPEVETDDQLKPKKVRTLSSGRRSPGRLVGAVGFVLLAALAAVGYLMVAAGGSNGGPIIGVDEAVVGQELVYSADVAEGSTFVWVDPAGSQITNPYLSVTPTSPGVVSFQMIESTATGTDIVHPFEVSVNDR